MCFWNERKKINFSLKPVPSWHSLYSGWLVIYLYTYTYLIAIYLLERQRCLGRAGIPRQNPQVLHLQALLNSDGEYLDGTSWDASHFLQTSFLVEKHTHTDNFPPSSLQSLSKHSFKDLRPLFLPLPRRSSRDVNSPAPVDCHLSQWSGWTDCFPCQEKKVRIHCNVFIYLQMCLWWGCTHINYIYIIHIHHSEASSKLIQIWWKCSSAREALYLPWCELGNKFIRSCKTGKAKSRQMVEESGQNSCPRLSSFSVSE